jgi:hypothetical protein
MNPTPLQTAQRALARKYAPSMPPLADERVSFTYGFGYDYIPGEKEVRLEGCILWQKEDKRLSYSLSLEEPSLQQSDGIEAFFQYIGKGLLPYLWSYIPEKGIEACMTPLWFDPPKGERRLVPGYLGNIPCQKKEVEEIFLAHVGCSAFMLSLARPIFHEAATGTWPTWQRCAHLFQREYARFRFLRAFKSAEQEITARLDGEEYDGESVLPLRTN